MRSLYFSWLQHRVLEREKLKLNLIYFSIVRIQNLVPDWFEVSDSEVFHCFVITVKTIWWTVLLFYSYCKSWPASRVHQAMPNSWPGSSRNVELIGNHYCLKLEFGLFMNLVLLSVQAVTLYTLAFDFKLNWTGLQMEPSLPILLMMCTVNVYCECVLLYLSWRLTVYWGCCKSANCSNIKSIYVANCITFSSYTSN